MAVLLSLNGMGVNIETYTHDNDTRTRQQSAVEWRRAINRQGRAGATAPLTW